MPKELFESGSGVWRGEASQIVRFLLVGALNTVVGFAVFLVGHHLFGLSLVAANAASYLIAIAASFFLTRVFVFRNVVPVFSIRFLGFFLGAGVAYFVNLFVILIMQSWGVLSDWMTHITGMGSYTVSFYLFNKFFIFRNSV